MNRSLGEYIVSSLSLSPPTNLLQKEQDFPYEEDIIRNPANLKSWLRYLEHKRLNTTPKERFWFFERALRDLPTSYKLWKAYLDERRDFVYENKLLNCQEASFANGCYERSLIFLNKMPRIWLDYCDFLSRQQKWQLAQSTFDRAIRSLPIMQHERIWVKYIEFATHNSIPIEASTSILKRYIQYHPKKKEFLVNFLVQNREFDEACLLLEECIQDPDYESSEFKTKTQLLKELCRIICEHSSFISARVDVEGILRRSLDRFPEKRGIIWCTLANWYIIGGGIERARLVFEEAMDSVDSLDDFTIVYDSYFKLEETLLESHLDRQENGETVDNLEMEMLSARIQRLLDEREVFVNDACLRKNPHNVYFWQKRLELFSSDAEQQQKIFKTALETVNPRRSIGKYESLWISYATSQSNAQRTREVFQEACRKDFKTPEELACVWIAFAEFELEQGNEGIEKAIALLDTATSPMKKGQSSEEWHQIHAKLHTSQTLWNFYLEILHQQQQPDRICAAYNKAIALKVCTCETIFNYTAYLESIGQVEEYFRVFERGIDLFGYPIAYELWNVYLPKIVAFLNGTKLDRLRDLFEQALENCPSEFAVNLSIFYGKVEEDFGLTRNAMKIYDSTARKADLKDRKKIYLYYIHRASHLYGLASTREVFEQAIANIPDVDACELCLMYAEVEEKLVEYERARLIFMHGAQLANPATNSAYWERWKRFELQHGDEASYAEMLRVKRSVQILFSTRIVIEKPSLVDGNAAPEFVPASNSVE